MAAALSDEIDPTRRGQDATVPPAGAKTLLERHEVQLDYPELPIPGTHFAVRSDWRYTRHTDAGDLSTTVGEVRTNPHALADKLLLTDRRLYSPGDTIRLVGLILPEECAPGAEEPVRPIRPADLRTVRAAAAAKPPPLSAATALPLAERAAPPAAVATNRCRCAHHHATAILTPTTVDRAFPIVLREPVAAQRAEILQLLVEIVQRSDDAELRARVIRLVRYGCLYAGSLAVDDLPLGPWRHYLFVQTVNTATAGMKPTEAAQIIGGLPVSQNTVPQVDVACGPLVVEDGQFDIELI